MFDEVQMTLVPSAQSQAGGLTLPEAQVIQESHASQVAHLTEHYLHVAISNPASSKYPYGHKQFGASTLVVAQVIHFSEVS
jgi:hypothetical protein